MLRYYGVGSEFLNRVFYLLSAENRVRLISHISGARTTQNFPPQPGQSLSQSRIFDSCGHLFKLAFRLRRKFDAGRSRAASGGGQNPLHEFQSLDCLITVKSVNAFQNLRLQMLDFEGGGPLHLDVEDGASDPLGRPACFSRQRSGEFQRVRRAVKRKVRPHDFLPMGQNMGLCKAAPAEGLPREAADQIADGRGAFCPARCFWFVAHDSLCPESAGMPRWLTWGPSLFHLMGMKQTAIAMERAEVAARLLGWYDRHARVLPWRARPGERADPYAVWLSEIMLQQTTVATVGPYFMRFLERWPTVMALAAAPVEEVMKEWAGLGYYSRARNLHACAVAVARDHGGVFPDDEKGLLALPGIGPYTAAAVSAIAFGRRAVVVDGNVERVVARLFALEAPLPAVKPEIRARTDEITPLRRAGDFAQAMMDLGATLCSPKRPSCNVCPIGDLCEARARGDQESFPRRGEKKPRPTRRGACFYLTRSDGAVLLRRRPNKGLLGGMMEVPTGIWAEEKYAEETLLEAAPARTGWKRVPGLVEHTFTHFHLELTVFTGSVTKRQATDIQGIWVTPEELADEALPTVMRKVVAHATPDEGPLFRRR